MSIPLEKQQFLLKLIKYSQYYCLTEKESLFLIRQNLKENISRSTYYNHKKKLCQNGKFQSLNKSIYKSKILKCFLFYLDEDDEPRDINMHNVLLEKFPEKKNVFEITEEQQNKIGQVIIKVKSNFCLNNVDTARGLSNLTRVNHLPINYTIRREYIRCGKEKMNKCKSLQHGPYYYAYWREKLSEQNKSILRKKYLGTIDPRL